MSLKKLKIANMAMSIANEFDYVPEPSRIDDVQDIFGRSWYVEYALIHHQGSSYLDMASEVQRIIDNIPEDGPTITGEFEKYDQVISYEINPEQQGDIFKRLMEYYQKHCHIGECIHQDDNSIIEAPQVLSEICDDMITFREEDIDV